MEDPVEPCNPESPEKQPSPAGLNHLDTNNTRSLPLPPAALPDEPAAKGGVMFEDAPDVDPNAVMWEFYAPTTGLSKCSSSNCFLRIDLLPNVQVKIEAALESK